MIEHTTATVLYRTNPHLDPRPRAVECADIIVRTIRGEVRPVQALEMPPLVVNIVKQFTGEEPMLSVMRDADEVMARPAVLSASVAEGYPYADVEEMGMGFLAISDNDEAAAREAARWMATAPGSGASCSSATLRRRPRRCGPPRPPSAARWC